MFSLLFFFGDLVEDARDWLEDYAPSLVWAALFIGSLVGFVALLSAGW